MSQPARSSAFLVTLAALASLAVAGCSRDGGRRKGDAAITTDTMLARDIARASGDTSGFTEAADIAQDAETDTLPSGSDSTRAATSPAMRVPGRSQTSPSPSSAPAPARSPATTPGGASGGTPGAARGVASDNNITLDASCNSPTLPNQRRCLLLYLAKSDQTLDRNYQALISDLKADAGTRPGEKEPPRVTRLRVAQRAWLVYRDTECRRRNRGQEGPLWAPTRARCLAEYSAKRAEELAAARNR